MDLIQKRNLIADCKRDKMRIMAFYLCKIYPGLTFGVEPRIWGISPRNFAIEEGWRFHVSG